jgi:hypothetical protein
MRDDQGREWEFLHLLDTREMMNALDENWQHMPQKELQSSYEILRLAHA